jgi:hypothetical protein
MIFLSRNGKKIENITSEIVGIVSAVCEYPKLNTRIMLRHKMFSNSRIKSSPLGNTAVYRATVPVAATPAMVFTVT